jgi:hypothetical protein
MNRKNFIVVLFGIFLGFKKRITLFLKKDRLIREESLKPDNKRLG